MAALPVLHICLDTQATHIYITSEISDALEGFTSVAFVPGGDEISKALVDFLRRKQGLRVDRHIAEQLVLSLGSALPQRVIEAGTADGHCTETGKRDTQELYSPHVTQAIKPILDHIRDVTVSHIKLILRDHAAIDPCIRLHGNYRDIPQLDLLLESALRQETQHNFTIVKAER